MENFQAADANKDNILDFAEFKAYHELMNKWNDEKFGGHDEFNEEQFKQMYDLISQGNAAGITLEHF